MTVATATVQPSSYSAGQHASTSVRTVLAPGTELLGQFRGSGYRQAPYLVRRADGQMLQLTRLSYLIAAAADGTRDHAAIAAVVSDQNDRPIDVDGVRYLVENKLAPLGIVTQVGTQAAAPRAVPVLVIRGRARLLDARVTGFAAAALRPLFYPVVVAAVLAGVAAVDYWLFVEHGLREAVHRVLGDPVILLAVLGLTLLSAVFHELGHAAGCRYGGARPGAIGVGLYLMWPSFFTDVTDAYRLGRAGRLRTDLGGIYFNFVFMLLLAGLYGVTGQQVLLIVIVLSHWEVLQQLLPFVRFDGYFILSDIAGIPDLFARIGPVVGHAFRHRTPPDPRVTQLRGSARTLVTAWVLCVIPFLGLNGGYLLLHLARMERALLRSTYLAGSRALTNVTSGHYAPALLDAVGCLLVTLTAAGLLYIAGLIVRQVGALYRRGPHRRRRDDALALAVAAVAAVGLGVIWITQRQLTG